MSEQVNLTDITIPPKRHRQQYDPERLANSMREAGLLQPIVLTDKKVLVAGLHRLRAAELLKWETIKAEFISGDELDAELAEIDENLIREQLAVHEQSEHIARREQIMQARGERAARGGSGSNQHESKTATVAGLQKTTAELARKAGMSERTYQQRAKIGHNLTQETHEIISELDPSESDLRNSTRQLIYLAGVKNPEDQEELARRVASGEAVSVWQASNQLKEERGELTTAELRQLGLQQAMKDEAESRRNEEPISVVDIRRAGKMEYVVEWSDGSANRVQRSSLLQEHGYKKCEHCSGYGVVKKGESG